MKGIITAIQKFSIQDGPGIRTTVFFKGCNMHCQWCHNPETYSAKRELMFYREKCVACDRCIQACPSHALFREQGHLFTTNACTDCGLCEQACVYNALQLSGTPMTVEEIASQVCEDIPFYQRSGGGVTLSGGEVGLQAPFACSLLEALKDKGIHCCIETNLSLDFEVYRPLIALCDLVIMDIKLLDNDKHIHYTGLSNRTVLENFRRLSALNKPTLIRTPIISGVNDTAEEIMAIRDYIKDAPNLTGYELLKYHDWGRNKANALGWSQHLFPPVDPIKFEQLQQIARI